MWLSTLSALAFAGTVHLHSVSLVQFRVDGVWVAKMVNDAVVRDLPTGDHLFEVCDVLGNVLGHATIFVDVDDVWIEYRNRRVDVVDPPKALPDYIAVDIPTISQADMVELERDLSRRRDKARMRVLLDAADRYWFEMRHVDSLLLAFDDLNVRLEAALVLATKTVDPQKFAAIEDRFPPGETRERARDAFLR